MRTRTAKMARKPIGWREEDALKSRLCSARRKGGFGPRLVFIASMFVVCAGWGVSTSALPFGFAVPLVSTLFLLLAGVSAAIAWHHRVSDLGDVTYADVAGALTLIGLCITAMIDPNEMLQLVQSAQMQN
jgi:hypothetical protein